MLSKARRLTRAEFSLLFATGERIHSSIFTCVFSKKTTQNPKIAVVVKKKAVRTAVERNKIRRRIYDFLEDKEITKNLIVIVTKEIKDADWKDVLVQTLKKHSGV